MLRKNKSKHHFRIGGIDSMLVLTIGMLVLFAVKLQSIILMDWLLGVAMGVLLTYWFIRWRF